MKKLLVCGGLLLLLLLYLLYNFYSSVPSRRYHSYTFAGKYAGKFSKAFIEKKTHIELANSEAAQLAVNEELNELKSFGMDIELEDLVTLQKKVTRTGNNGVRSYLDKPTENPMESEDIDETSRKRIAHDNNEILPKESRKYEPQNKTSRYAPTFRVRNPDSDDLWKLTKEQAIHESESDPLPLSPYCKQEVFLTILVISQPENVERRKYIRESWAFSYEDDYRKLKGKQPFPNGKVYIPKNVVRVVFVLGHSKDRSNNVMELVKEEAGIHKDIVLGNVIEDYRNLTLKTKLGLKWAYFDCKTVFVLKTDDDVFINPVPLVEWLKKVPNMNLYTGWCNFNSPVIREKNHKWYVSYEDYKGAKFPGYCLGGGYLMSGDVLASLIKMSYGRKLFPMEDLYVGLMIQEMNGVQPRDEKKHFNLVYGGKTKDDCDFNGLFLLHRVLSKNLITHIKQAKHALENC